MDCIQGGLKNFSTTRTAVLQKQLNISLQNYFVVIHSCYVPANVQLVRMTYDTCQRRLSFVDVETGC